MKRILAPILLMTLLFPALAFGETYGDLVETDGLYYKKFTEVPFTGKTTGKIQGSFKNGKKHGPWVRYHDNGRLEVKVTYKNGKPDGPWVTHHDNGQLETKGTYKNGKVDGPGVGYYEDGQLASKGTWKDGKKDGPWVGFLKDGTIQKSFTGTFKDGVKVK
jgi:antitoxin component YwqK of YwqJK toxin-antitoxin module